MLPKQIAKSSYKIQDFIAWQRSGTLELSPSFQRRSVWKKSEKSFFLDTVIRGLPVPLIFLREKTKLDSPESVREVVDGQQRLRTLFAFIDSGLLDDYDEDRDLFQIRAAHNKELSNKPYERLPIDVQRQIRTYEISTHTLPSGTDDREVLQIFARINSSGTKTNHQELRNAQFTGEFKLLMYELAREQLERWRSWGIYDEIRIARMAEVEFTSEMVMLMHLGLHARRQSAIDSFYKQYEEDSKSGEGGNYPHARVVARRFRNMMDAIDDTVGDVLADLAFSRPALFHSLSTFFYDILYGLNSELSRAKPERLPPGLQKGLMAAAGAIDRREYDESLAKSLRGATTDLGTRQVRLDFLKQHCGIT